MKEVFWVALGGTMGALARFLSYKLLNSIFIGSFPIATLLINALGSFLFGLFLQQIRSSPAFGLFFAVGLLASFTTFSTFSFESVQLLKDGRIQLFALNIIGSVLIGLASFALGDWINGRIRIL